VRLCPSRMIARRRTCEWLPASPECGPPNPRNRQSSAASGASRRDLGSASTALRAGEHGRNPAGHSIFGSANPNQRDEVGSGRRQLVHPLRLRRKRPLNSQDQACFKHSNKRHRSVKPTVRVFNADPWNARSARTDRRRGLGLLCSTFSGFAAQGR
jgi:hypothetical protein